MTPKDAFLLFLEQPAELVALLKHDDVWYAVWTKPEPVFADRPFNVHVFKYGVTRIAEDASMVHLMRSGEYDLTMPKAIKLVYDLMNGVTI